MKSTKFFASLLISLNLLAPSALFAKSVDGIIDINAQTVTKMNFLTWTFVALEIPKLDGDCTLPYTRVARGYRETLCTSQTLGALEVFHPRKKFDLNTPITRGEALLLLTAIMDKNGAADVSSFRDVQTNDLKRAVQNALYYHWMSPQREAVFGVNQLLTGKEAVSLLTAASVMSTSQNTTLDISINYNRQELLPSQDLMFSVWSLIQRDYIHKDTIDTQEAAYKAIEGLVDSLNDPYSNFFRPSSAKDFQSQLKGELSGIGAQIEEKDGIITIVAPIKGSPAERAGLTTGDQILESDGVSLIDIGTDRAVTYIRGERGTSVVLKIRRNGSEFTVTVLRDLISIPEIELSWQGDIAIVQLAQFGETTLKNIRMIFSDIQKKNPRGIVLDLRNNGGGLLTAADTVMSNFVPKGSVVAQVKTFSQTTKEKTDTDPTIAESTKIVVLVNKGSASASEIVAGALQDAARAKIVGTVTFGKGTVQEVIGFQSGEALKLTIAEWLTPLGRHINGIGVTPDFLIEDPDSQLRKALDLLR